jgi:mono/diheme cytochrome c family protein
MAQERTMTAKSIATNIVCVVIVAPVLAVLIVWGAWVFKPDPPPQKSSHGATPSHAADTRPAPQTPVSGRTVYMASCARCHGASGDGHGTEKLDRPARSFLEGGFSFGNTTEAVRRVVLHGIAGTPMQGFARTLDGAQVRAVVQYVIGLAPPEPPPSDDAQLVVGDRPLVVRGMLPARGAWEDDQPRGLLIGGTDGLTLAWDLDEVRFRAARQGRFVNRTDWEGRGGTALEPLGRVIHWAPPRSAFSIDGQEVPAEFLGTTIRDGVASLQMQLPGARVLEHGTVSSVGELPGYVRTLVFDGDASAITMGLPAQGMPEYLGRSELWEWWRDGADLIGVRGAAGVVGSRVQLPASGEVEIIVLPGADIGKAIRAGIPGLESSA